MISRPNSFENSYEFSLRVRPRILSRCRLLHPSLERGGTQRAFLSSGGDDAPLVEAAQGSPKLVSKSPHRQMARSYAPPPSQPRALRHVTTVCSSHAPRSLRQFSAWASREGVAIAPQGAVFGLFTLRFCDTAEG